MPAYLSSVYQLRGICSDGHVEFSRRVWTDLSDAQGMQEQFGLECRRRNEYLEPSWIVDIIRLEVVDYGPDCF